jgi:TetR/AcrR family transcriptional regulator, transcriptional repressor for nem operon
MSNNTGRGGRIIRTSVRIVKPDLRSVVLGSDFDRFYLSMPKPSLKDKIVLEGLKVMWDRGYVGASVRDIVSAAGVPQGSFTNHFRSKEAFALEVLEAYFAHSRREVIEVTLQNEKLPPLGRLRAYIDATRDQLRRQGMQNGCLIGNFAAEASDHSEIIRVRLSEIISEIQQAVASCLKAAVTAGELPRRLDCKEMAGFIVSSLQGAMLIAKAERSSDPIDRFERMLFWLLKH